MSRFFVKEADVHSDFIDITGEDVSHIRKVLRLRCGDQITVCDGKGNDYLVNIEQIENDQVCTRIISSKKTETEPPIEVTLFQGIPKSDKMDWIIQKCVELGIHKIVPVHTERTIVKIESKKDAENKVGRWQRISSEAAKQCNRGIIPKVEYPVCFEEALKMAGESDLSIMPYEKENSQGLRSCLTVQDIKKIAFFIGPEGGFSEKEVEKATLNGTSTVTLGPRILRTETAGITALTIIMYQLGDMGK